MVRLPLPILGLTGFLLLLPILLWAGAPTDQLQAAVQKVTRILEDPALKPEAKALERQGTVGAAVADLFNFAEISRRALARHWRQLSEPEREEFVTLFRALLERTYLPKIKLYQAERVHFLNELQDGNLATVQARVVTRREREVPVTYRLHRIGERWLIHDVSVEGVSLVANYRAQFDQIIQRASVPGLVARIRQRLAASEFLDEEGSANTPNRK
ncbi:MAG: ABC transporter substrate-binding protein [Candidatus Rokubacteria bacterium]|nr:ABC transporter substrate-binding protein [Candidatus Rokubacteria bacterium]